jgi:hypothetical protein
MSWQKVHCHNFGSGDLVVLIYLVFERNMLAAFSFEKEI